jgi:hypothetical protein
VSTHDAPSELGLGSPRPHQFRRGGSVSADTRPAMAYDPLDGAADETFAWTICRIPVRPFVYIAKENS